MMTDSVKLTVKRRFDASPERVFDAWLDPQVARQWLYTTADSEVVRAEVDARVGGRFTFTDRRDDGDIEHVGEYLVIERPTRLVFTFAVPAFSPEYDRVEIEIVRLDKGCELTLTNQMSPEIYAEWGEKTREGWTAMLGGLAETLEPEEPDMLDRKEGQGAIQAQQTVRIERVLPGPVERVWSYLTESGMRRKWLAAGPMEPAVGGRVEHLYRHKELSSEPTPEKYRDMETSPAMLGAVTQWDPPRVLAYTWPGDNGSSEVTFELFPEGGEVLLVLTHRRLADAATMISVASGWDAHLGILIDRLNGDEPRGFWSTHARLEKVYSARFATGGP